jgi:hypothetical protein
MLVKMPTWQPIKNWHDKLVSTIELMDGNLWIFVQEIWMDEIIFKLNCK